MKNKAQVVVIGGGVVGAGTLYHLAKKDGPMLYYLSVKI